jgi:tripartite-type tricarboxylate transporter receptor subunit TctC
MKLPHRRQFLHLAAGAAALPLAPHVARAQAYPSRPVRLVVPFPAGGPNDVFARLMGQWLTERLNQPFIIDNRPGAGGNIGTDSVVKAPADGHTFLVINSNHAVNVSLYEKPPFDFMRDIAPVAAILVIPHVLVLNPSVPAQTVPELIAYAKANPGKLNYASVGIGSTPHVAAELFKMMAGIDMVHVPYRGGAPAVTDLISGQVQAGFIAPAVVAQHIRAGKLRGLAVTSSARSDILPDLPTVDSFIPGYEATSWFGIGAPKNTPDNVIAVLNGHINAGLADPKIKSQLTDLGGKILALSPAEFRSVISDDIAKWAKVVRFANIKPE